MSELGDTQGPLDPGQAAVRVGSAEREAAVAALNAHREAGRLTSQEYEDRSVRAGQATTRGDLAALFTDLPQPRPAQPAPSTPAQPSGWTGSGQVEPGRPSGVLPARWAATAVAATPILATLLFFTTGYHWEWFLLVPLVGILARGGRGHRRR